MANPAGNGCMCVDGFEMVNGVCRPMQQQPPTQEDSENSFIPENTGSSFIPSTPQPQP